jgi:hypothetical protein
MLFIFKKLLRQLGDVRRDPPRFILGEQFSAPSSVKRGTQRIAD